MLNSLTDSSSLFRAQSSVGYFFLYCKRQNDGKVTLRWLKTKRATLISLCGNSRQCLTKKCNAGHPLCTCCQSVHVIVFGSGGAILEKKSTYKALICSSMSFTNCNLARCCTAMQTYKRPPLALPSSHEGAWVYI